MAINERLIHTAAEVEAATGTGNQQEGLILHLDANDVDSYDGDGSIWYDITNHEYTPAVDPAEHFNTVLYTGDDSDDRAITGVGFQPDLVWIKARNSTAHHSIMDSVRGASSIMGSSYNNAASTQNASWRATYGELDSFDSDGFTVSDGTNASSNFNSSHNYVAWCFKAGGAPTASTPYMVDGTGYATASAAGMGDDGDLDLKKASVNTKLGFGIYNIDPSLTSSETNSFTHGLGATPELIITKNTGMTTNWWTFTNKIDGSWDYFKLNGNTAKTDDTYTTGAAADTTTIRVDEAFYANSSDAVLYAFTSKRGVSKVGSYEGNSSSTGVKVYTGFEPAFIMFKPADAATGWSIHDNKRGTDKQLNPDINGAETTGWSPYLEFHGDGFKVKGNSSGLNPSSTMIYLAFAAEKPSSLTPTREDFTEGTVTSGAEVELDANDYSGSGNWLNTGDSSGYDGTISGATYTNDGSSDYFDFDGSNDYVSLSGNLNSSTKAFEIWLNPDSFSSDSWAFQQGDGQSVENYLRVYSSGLQVRMGNQTVTHTYSTTNKWIHVVGTHKTGNGFEFYLDGEKVKESTSALTALSNNYFHIGARRNTSLSGYFNGKIGIVRVYDFALTGTQIKTNYDATKGLYQYPGLALHFDAADLTSAANTTWTDKVASLALTKSGTVGYDDELGDFIDFGGGYYGNDSATNQIKDSNGDYTVEFWYNFHQSSSYTNIVGAMQDASNRGLLLGFHHSYGVFIYNYKDGTMDASQFAEPTFANLGITYGRWYHVAIRTDASTDIRFYIDGELKHTSTSNAGGTHWNTFDGIRFGDMETVSHTSDGLLGQIRFYKGLLTQEEIRQNYRFTKNNYPNAVNFSNAGDRANWLDEGSWNFDAGANEYFSNNYTNGSPGMFQHRTGTGNFAISAWVKPDNVTASWRVIIGCQGYSSDGWQLYANQDDIRFWGSNGTNYELVTLNGVLTANTWTHVVVQRTNTTWEGYIDGSSSTNSATNKTQHLTDPMGNDHATNSNLIIGRDWTANQYQWDGRISDIKIFNKALTAAEVTAEYNKGQFGDK